MPNGVTDFGAGAWMSALFGIDSDITSYYLALASDEPGIASDGTILAALEPPDGSNYARQPYPTGGSYWAANGSYLTNLVEIVFPLPFTDWGRLAYYVLCDSLTDGEVYAWGEFTNPQYVTTAYSMSLPVGGVVLSLGSLENSISV
jgi:hypothetical protein